MDLPIPPVNSIENEAYKSCFVVGSLLESELRNTRQECVEALHTLQEEMGVLKSRSSLLQGQSRELKARIAKLNAAVAPHRKLPTEVLRYIFRLAHANEKPLQLPRAKFQTSDINKRLSKRHTFRPHHVCSFWRQVALTIPEICKAIWYHVEINYSNFDDPYIDWDGDWSFDEGCDAEETAKEELFMYIRSMTRFAKTTLLNETQSLTITFPFTEVQWVDDIPVPGLLGELLCSPPPKLEALKIKNNLVSEEFLEAVSKALISLPELKCLEMDLRYHCDDESFISLPYEKLTNLTYLDCSRNLEYDIATVLSMQDCHCILKSCPRLEEFILTISCQFGRDDPSSAEKSDNLITHGRLNALRFLKLSCACEWVLDECNPTALLERLALPSLQVLDIVSEDPFSAEIQSLNNFFQRSRCHLTHLGMRSTITEESQEFNWEISITNLWKDLSTLSVPQHRIPLDTIRMIASEEHFPKLESLECRVEAVEECCSAVEMLLRSRYIQRHSDSNVPESIVKFRVDQKGR